MRSSLSKHSCCRSSIRYCPSVLSRPWHRVLRHSQCTSFAPRLRPSSIVYAFGLVSHFCRQLQSWSPCQFSTSHYNSELVFEPCSRGSVQNSQDTLIVFVAASTLPHPLSPATSFIHTSSPDSSTCPFAPGVADVAAHLTWSVLRV